MNLGQTCEHYMQTFPELHTDAWRYTLTLKDRESISFCVIEDLNFHLRMYGCSSLNEKILQTIKDEFKLSKVES